MYWCDVRKRSTKFVCNLNLFEPVAKGSNLVALRGQGVDRSSSRTECCRQHFSFDAVTSAHEDKAGNRSVPPFHRFIDQRSCQHSPRCNCQRRNGSSREGKNCQGKNWGDIEQRDFEGGRGSMLRVTHLRTSHTFKEAGLWIKLHSPIMTKMFACASCEPCEIQSACVRFNPHACLRLVGLSWGALHWCAYLIARTFIRT